MKKVLYFLATFVIVGLVACGPSAEEQAKMEADAEKAANEMLNNMLDEGDADEAEVEVGDAMAEHVCDAKCETDGCTGPRCGETGHTCSDACHAGESEDEHAGHNH